MSLGVLAYVTIGLVVVVPVKRVLLCFEKPLAALQLVSQPTHLSTNRLLAENSISSCLLGPPFFPSFIFLFVSTP